MAITNGVSDQVQAAVEAGGHHGADLRGLATVPQSPLFEGRFGRMFRGLPAHPGIDAITALVRDGRPGEAAPATTRRSRPATRTSGSSSTTTSPSTRSRSCRSRTTPTRWSTSARRASISTPCTAGPADQPVPVRVEQPRATAACKLLVGHNPQDDGDARARRPAAQPAGPRADRRPAQRREHHRLASCSCVHPLPQQGRRARPRSHPQLKGARAVRRGAAGRALALPVDRGPRLPDRGSSARRRPRRSSAGAAGAADRPAQFFTWVNEPFIPVEFSGAAYRFGHSMVRPDYDLNETVQEVPIFARRRRARTRSTHLGGFRRLPSCWTVDWERFFKIGGRAPQLSRKIDTKLSPPLFQLPRGSTSSATRSRSSTCGAGARWACRRARRSRGRWARRR